MKKATYILMTELEIHSGIIMLDLFLIPQLKYVVDTSVDCILTTVDE